jgi:hypothetical protein
MLVMARVMETKFVPASLEGETNGSMSAKMMFNIYSKLLNTILVHDKFNLGRKNYTFAQIPVNCGVMDLFSRPMLILANRFLSAFRGQMGFLKTLFFLALIFPACNTIPKAPLSGGKQITVGLGTEDLVVNDFGQEPQLLVSCGDHRHPKDTTHFGAIVSYDLQNGKIDTLQIREFPRGLDFRPHGIDIQQISDRIQLYVVCHDDFNQKHWISVFQVVDNDLYWIKNFPDSVVTVPNHVSPYPATLLPSPNAVAALPDGSFYVTNDHLKRGNFKEDLLSKKASTIVRFEPDGSYKVAFSGIAYANGITYRDGYIYVSATREHKIYRLKVGTDGLLSEQTCIAKLKGPDNLRWDGDKLIVACHLKPFKFIGHARKEKKHSPTVVYSISLDGAEPVAIYADRKGKTISAGATGLIFKDRLFIGQVFGDQIVEVKK